MCAVSVFVLWQVRSSRTLIPVHVYTTNAHHTTHLTCFITGQTRAINFIDKRKSNHNEICATHNKILIHTLDDTDTHTRIRFHTCLYNTHTLMDYIRIQLKTSMSRGMCNNRDDDDETAAMGAPIH